MKRLDDDNSLELLEAIATKHDLLLSDNLIDFVSELRGLIVKECMKVADEGMAQVTMKVEWPSYHIKKHFGVEP